ncbi:hypothetical protein MML48_8g00007917 [Holotrichia oblita]|uniref:Uncharacterized protein n=1 Tax=Holotrichia oblita TaxID=644536 RepID=A0ACB9ST56_HOLOL|nr:hypothetical protein MML48_8g00007917 [Holotrichia oblita]
MSESPSRRDANFTPEEIDLLIDLVKSKRYNRFNLLSGQIYRSTIVLRKKYENIKKRTKQKFSDNRCHVTGTGEGPSSHVIYTHVDEEVKDLLGVRLEGLPSYCDSDTASTAHEHAREEVIVIQGDALPSSSKESQETTWESHAPSMLSEPVSALKRPIENEPAAPIAAKKRKVTGTYEKWSSLADDKVNYVTLQTRISKLDRALRLQSKLVVRKDISTQMNFQTEKACADIENSQNQKNKRNYNHLRAQENWFGFNHEVVEEEIDCNESEESKNEEIFNESF